MSLYQVSVLKNYINLQEKEAVEKAYKKYVKYFLNPTIQENIRSSKEEEYQGIFLTELFANILGYTLKPKADFNLVAEYKNQTNARKADGAILHNDIAIGVIELKGTNTKDLESIRKQAFDYKANQKGCVYVITSNFEKLRFYINDATEFEEFNLFELTKERFKLFYLCLQKDNIINNVPLKIKEASIVKEEQITKEFYKDYSLFKRELYRDLVKNNVKRLKLESSLRAETKQPLEELSEEQKAELIQLDKNVKLTLFKKSQKLIDRFLFIFFAEDRGLLPANSTELILEKWKADIDFGDERPLYNLFKQYFTFLDQGRQGTKSRGEIYAYNGGLFKEDTLLDGLLIDNELLYKHTHKLAGYDFESQVDVNILGHIFENSLNEIESVNAEIEGADFDKQTSKRKKDGVFYTPKYITKYIVENTVGKLCEEKKAELDIREEEYFKGRKNRNKTTITKLVDILDAYRDWLLQLTICDPACGSGAFLNQALDFLIKEHTYIDELKTKVLGGGLQFSDIENTILENNIFGVDLNEESVEIAKLSLWLRTAQPRRKLNDLSSNIKCGNSLIDNKKVAGDKAFNWETEFPQVFEKDGFDVIIGNPPYGAKLSKEVQGYLNKEYIKGGSETVISFLKLSYDLLKTHGEFGFIIPKSFSFSSNYSEIRSFLVSDITTIVDCKKVWKEVKLEQVIVQFKKLINTTHFDSSILENQEIKKIGEISKKTFNEFGFLLNGISNSELKIAYKLLNSNKFINEIATNQRGGPLQKLISENGDVKVLAGANIQRKGIKGFKGYANVKEIGGDKKNFISSNSILVQNIVSHINNPVEHIKIISCAPDKNLIGNTALLDTINQIKFDDSVSNEVMVEILNSKLINWFCFRFIFGKAIRTMHFDNAVTRRIPVPIEINDNLFLAYINKKKLLLIKMNKNIELFLKYISELHSIDISSNKKIMSWYKYDFKIFIKELKKELNNKINSDEEFRLFEIFDTKKNEVITSQEQLNELDDILNDLIYQSFNLNKDDITLINKQMP